MKKHIMIVLIVLSVFLAACEPEVITVHENDQQFQTVIVVTRTPDGSPPCSYD